MLKLKNNRAVFISGKDEAVIPNVTFTKEQFERFEKHIKKMYGNGFTYGNVINELNHFKF